MAFVRTIAGDVDPTSLGVVNAHDHLIRIGAGEVHLDPDHLLDDVDKAVEEAASFVAAARRWSHGGTVVDMCPVDCGRDVRKLAEVNSRVPDLQILVATGFQRERAYLETTCHWVSRYSVDQIAELLIADIVEGVDQHDYSGPVVERTEHKAGVVKVASSYGRITAWEGKTLRAAAIASIETGCPINTHTTAGTCALEQAQCLIKAGVPGERIAIGHVQRNADVWYLSKIAELGCYLELDGTHRPEYVPDSSRVMLVAQLGRLGFGRQIILGTDSGRRSSQKAYGAVCGVDFDAAVFGPRLLDEGLELEYVEDLLIGNAQRFLTFGKGHR